MITTWVLSVSMVIGVNCCVAKSFPWPPQLTTLLKHWFDIWLTVFMKGRGRTIFKGNWCFLQSAVYTFQRSSSFQIKALYSVLTVSLKVVWLPLHSWFSVSQLLTCTMQEVAMQNADEASYWGRRNVYRCLSLCETWKCKTGLSSGPYQEERHCTFLSSDIIFCVTLRKCLFCFVTAQIYLLWHASVL